MAQVGQQRDGGPDGLNTAPARSRTVVPPAAIEVLGLPVSHRLVHIQIFLMAFLQLNKLMNRDNPKHPENQFDFVVHVQCIRSATCRSYSLRVVLDNRLN